MADPHSCCISLITTQPTLQSTRLLALVSSGKCWVSCDGAISCVFLLGCCIKLIFPYEWPSPLTCTMFVLIRKRRCTTFSLTESQRKSTVSIWLFGCSLLHLQLLRFAKKSAKIVVHWSTSNIPHFQVHLLTFALFVGLLVISPCEYIVAGIYRVLPSKSVFLLWNQVSTWFFDVIPFISSLTTCLFLEMYQFVPTGSRAVSPIISIDIWVFSSAFTVVEICWKCRRNWRPSKSVKNPAFLSSFTHLCSFCLIVGFGEARFGERMVPIVHFFRSALFTVELSHFLCLFFCKYMLLATVRRVLSKTYCFHELTSNFCILLLQALEVLRV